MLKRYYPLEMNSYFDDTTSKWDEPDVEPSAKQRKSSNSFLLFCKMILDYERYEPQDKEEIHDTVYSKSTTKTDDSFSTESNSSFSSIGSSDEPRVVEKISDKESEHLITCYCMKPFAGRPMIECTECQTWIHMSCANVRRKNIPEVFICQQCREASGRARRSQRIRGDYRRILSE